MTLPRTEALPGIEAGIETAWYFRLALSVPVDVSGSDAGQDNLRLDAVLNELHTEMIIE